MAANEIYANRASLVGSIGVRMDSFGFTDAMQRLGIERRLYVAGDLETGIDYTPPPDWAGGIGKWLGGVLSRALSGAVAAIRF